jgi:hypothetical protein
MRESCSCGAAVHSFFYRRVLHWRTSHKCNAYTTLMGLEAQVEEAYFDFIAEEEEE